MKKLLFATLIILAGCAKIQNENQLDPKRGAMIHSTIKAYQEADKTGLGSKGEYVWSEGDKIGLFSSAGTLVNVIATLESGAGEQMGVFGYDSDTTLQEHEKIYAYYPYNASATISGTVITTILPNAQCYETLSGAVSGCIFAGREDETPERTMRFTNTCSIIGISFVGTDKLRTVSLMARDESLTGYGSFDINGTDLVFSINDNSPSSGKSTGAAYATRCTGSTDTTSLATLSGTPYKCYFVVPSGAYAAEDLYIETITDKYSMVKVSSAEYIFSANHYTPFGNITVAKPSYPSATNLGLSSSGKVYCSNCFTVKPSSTDASYFFPAYRADVTLPYGSTDPDKDAKGAAARVVWETHPGLVKNVTIDWEHKNIYFDVPGNNQAGSAIIGILNQYNNSIYWLWHIWISDVKDQSWSGSPVFLDRDLGAEWTPKTFKEVADLTAETALATTGLLYQYGNSYPFPRTSTLEPEFLNTSTRNQEKTAFKDFTPEVQVYRFGKWTQGFYSQYRTSTATNWTMDDLRWYPFAFNYASGEDTNSEYGCSWARNVKPYTAGNYGWGTGSTKARRDPCPAGYKVPSDAEMVWFRRPNTGKRTDGNAWYWQYLLNESKQVCTGSGIYINLGLQTYGVFQTTDWKRNTSDAGSGEVIWFPKGGGRFGKGFGNAGAMEGQGYHFKSGATTATSGYGFYWCVSPAASNNIEGVSTIQSSKGSSTSTGECWESGAGNLFCWGYVAASSAFSIRCVKMAASSDNVLDAGSLVDGGTDPNPWE